MRRFALPLVVAFATITCGPSAEEQAAEAAAAAAAAEDSVMTEAQAVFDASVFDTLSWPDENRRAEYGPTVYLSSCAKCHGAGGLGDGGFVLAGDTLRPASFKEPDWALAGNLEGIREAVFLGNREGMPHWGIVGLSYGAVDAVAQYIADGMPSG